MIYIIIILLIFIIDDKVKEYIDKNKVLNKSEEILKGNIFIEKYYNKGIMLNFFEKRVRLVKYLSGILLGIISLYFLITLPKEGKKLLKLSLAFIIGGASSNVYDRIKKGHVVDYFGFKCLKNVIFNLSDIFIFLGSLLLTIYSFCSEIKKK